MIYIRTYFDTYNMYILNLAIKKLQTVAVLLLVIGKKGLWWAIFFPLFYFQTDIFFILYKNQTMWSLVCMCVCRAQRPIYPCSLYRHHSKSSCGRTQVAITLCNTMLVSKERLCGGKIENPWPQREPHVRRSQVTGH